MRHDSRFPEGRVALVAGIADERSIATARRPAPPRASIMSRPSPPRAQARAPRRRLVTIEEIGHVAAMLCADGARGVTGTVTFIDGGLHAVA